jgi:hypothetical protein
VIKASDVLGVGVEKANLLARHIAHMTSMPRSPVLDRSTSISLFSDHANSLELLDDLVAASVHRPALLPPSAILSVEGTVPYFPEVPTHQLAKKKQHTYYWVCVSDQLATLSKQN